MWDFSQPALFGARKLADGYHANFSCLSLPRLTVRRDRPHSSCASLLLLWLGLCSSVLSHLVYSNLAIPALQWHNSQFCHAPSYFHPEQSLPQRVNSVLLSLLPPAKTGYVATGKCSTSVWRSASCHKGNNRGHKAAPKAPVQQSISDQQSI